RWRFARLPRPACGQGPPPRRQPRLLPGRRRAGSCGGSSSGTFSWRGSFREDGSIQLERFGLESAEGGAGRGDGPVVVGELGGTNGLEEGRGRGLHVTLVEALLLPDR